MSATRTTCYQEFLSRKGDDFLLYLIVGLFMASERKGRHVMIGANKYNVGASPRNPLPVMRRASDIPSRMVSLADKLQPCMRSNNQQGKLMKKSERQLKWLAAEPALRRMMEQGHGYKQIITAIEKNFDFKVHPSDISRYRRKWGMETPLMLKVLETKLAKKDVSQPVNNPVEIEPAPRDQPAVAQSVEPEATPLKAVKPAKVDMSTIIQSLQHELVRMGIKSIRVPARGRAELDLGDNY